MASNFEQINRILFDSTNSDLEGLRRLRRLFRGGGLFPSEGDPVLGPLGGSNDPVIPLGITPPDILTFRFGSRRCLRGREEFFNGVDLTPQDWSGKKCLL